MDYYEILSVPRCASDEEIKKSYRRLAMKWHPDKNSDEAASQKFQEIGQAYAILSDKNKRTQYDQFGSVGEEEEEPGRDAREVFNEFFGTANPFASFGFGDSVPFASRLRKPGPRKPEDIARSLDCTLEELFQGCVKKFSVTRKRRNEEKFVDEKKTLQVNVLPGWKHGTKVTFKGEGDEAPNIVPADIVFQLNQLPHRLFKREGSNLVYSAQVSLLDALVGTVLHVPTLDGRTLSLSCPEVLSPGYRKIIPNEGMPHSKTPQIRGNMIVEFRLDFPKYLDENQKGLVKQAFGQPRQKHESDSQEQEHYR